jgi:hypothetical protein
MTRMADDHTRSFRSRPLKPLTDIGGRAAAALRPISGAVGAAAQAGISLEQRGGPLLDSGELERLLDSARLHAIVAQVVESDGATQLIDTFFDSGLFDRFIACLLSSDGLVRLVDEIAASATGRRFRSRGWGSEIRWATP